MEKIFQYRAYGSVMLFGEYAVLHQGFGICSAIDQSITASLELQPDRSIQIHSQFGNLSASLDALPQAHELDYVCAAIEACKDLLTTGFTLSLHSTIDVCVGLGSSAATLCSVVGVLCKSQGIWEFEVILPRVLKALKIVSPLASGCDCVASLSAGTVAYNPRTQERVPYHKPFDLTALYSGTKTISQVELAKLEEKRKSDPVSVAKIYEKIDKITQLAMRALENNDLHRLGELMSLHHQDQVALGTSTPVLDRLITILQKDPDILGAKISGAGNGDCVIGLGSTFVELPLDLENARVFHLKTLPGHHG